MIKTVPIFNSELIEFAEIELSKILFIYKKFYTENEPTNFYKVKLVNNSECFISEKVYDLNFRPC